MEQVRQGGLKVGDVIANRYEVGRLIAEGGMSSIHMGRQLGLNRRVAIKVLSPEESRDPEGASLFRREAIAVKHLTHPNTVRIYDFGETDSGLLFLVMEYLEGSCLDQVLYKRGSLPLPMVVRIGEQVLKSLIEAHARGIVHRDVKPSNLMLCRQLGEDNFIKVLDFGIAHHRLNEAPDSPNRPGEVMGTPRYMSPEQLRGDDVDPRSDLYSLGLTLYELVTGLPVFPQVELKDMLAERALGGPIGIPYTLADTRLGYVIGRSLEEDVDRRFRAAGDMLEALIATPDTVWPDVSTPRAQATAAGAPIAGDADVDLARYALDPTLPRMPGSPVTTNPSVRVVKSTTPVPAHRVCVPRVSTPRPVPTALRRSGEIPPPASEPLDLAPPIKPAIAPTRETTIHDPSLSDLIRTRIEDRLRRRTLATVAVTLMVVLVSALLFWVCCG